MDQENRRILIQAMIVAAQAKIAGMQAHDSVEIASGKNRVYSEREYEKVCEYFGITHNQVISYLGGD